MSLAAGLQSRDRKRLNSIPKLKLSRAVRQGRKCEYLVKRFLKEKSPNKNLAWNNCLSDFLHQPSVLRRIMRSSCHMGFIFTLLTSFSSRGPTWPVLTVLTPCSSTGCAVAADKSKRDPLMFRGQRIRHNLYPLMILAR